MPDTKDHGLSSSYDEGKSFFSGLLMRIQGEKPFLSSDTVTDGLNYWRARILLSIVTIGAGISIFAVVPAVYLALTTKRWLLLIVNISGFILMLVLLFSSHFGQKIQSLIILLITFTVGVVIIIQVGFLSGGPIWLFSFSVVASLLFGLRAALATALLNGTVIILLAWLSFPGQTGEQSFLSSLGRFMAALGSFMILNIIVSISVAVLVNGLKNLNQSAVNAAADLKQEKIVLLKTRGKLIDEIEERKRIAYELEKARETAEAANHAKSEFLANMSHELRTPLNHIIGFTELVTDRTVGPVTATQEEYLNDVLGSSRHLLSLINDILDLSKIETGKMELVVSEIAFQSLLENSLVMIKEKAMTHGIKTGTRFTEIPPTIRADEGKLKQILYNLLSNAVKFTPDGGSILLEARNADGQGVQITVSDTGIGLPEGDLERIFKPFEQGDNSAGRKYQGTGLGLALTRKMVELHGGRIWAESKGRGTGSNFTFTLPSRFVEEIQSKDSLNKTLR